MSRIEQHGIEHIIPRSPMVGAPEEDIEGEGGFFAIEHDDLWSGDDDDLPEFWFNERRSGRVHQVQLCSISPSTIHHHPQWEARRRRRQRTKGMVPAETVFDLPALPCRL